MKSAVLRGPDGRPLRGSDGRALVGPDGRVLRNWRGEALTALACVLAFALSGCSLTKALYRDTPDRKVSRECELLACEADTSPAMDARAHRTSDADAAAAWLREETDPAARPCARECHGPRPIPPGCWATCTLLAGHPLVTPEERTDFAPGGPP
jgi:hypothetical protein